MMSDGVLVLVDCLGFRGIWRRCEPQQLIDKLVSLETIAAKRIIPKYSATELSYGKVRFHLRLLSDTVALSVQYEPIPGKTPSERQKNLLVSIACESAALLSKLFIDDDAVPLLLRGCISFGQHLCQSNFLVGPAVDEAAEYMNEPEGAFIWLLPSAASRHAEFLKDSANMLKHISDRALERIFTFLEQKGLREVAELRRQSKTWTPEHWRAIRQLFLHVLHGPNVVESYPLPVKRSPFIDAAVINPLAFGNTVSERHRMIRLYELFLQGDRIDIWVKRQNTLKFLAAADEAVSTFHSEIKTGETPRKILEFLES